MAAKTKTTITVNSENEILNIRNNWKKIIPNAGEHIDTYFEVLGTGRSVYNSLDVSKKHIIDNWKLIEEIGFPMNITVTTW